MKVDGGYGVDQGWRDDGLGQQRDDCGGCSIMRKRLEGAKSPGAYVDG